MNDSKTQEIQGIGEVKNSVSKGDGEEKQAGEGVYISTYSTVYLSLNSII